MGEPMNPRMAERKRQQRAAMIVGGAAVGGLAIIGLAIALSSGGDDDTNAIDTRRTTTTSSSTTSSSSTSTSTTTLVTVPTTVPTTPPTTIVIPTLPPPTEPPTSPPTTAAPTTAPPTTAAPTTTTTLSPQKQLTNTINTALNGGTPPAPGQGRVTNLHLADAGDPDDQTRVRWKLIDTLTPEQQEVQARIDTWNVLKSLQDAALPGTNPVVIKATVPQSDGTGTKVVIVAELSRQSLDAIDFATLAPADVFSAIPLCSAEPTPPCYEELDVDTDVVPPSTTTSSSTSTTTTT